MEVDHDVKLRMEMEDDDSICSIAGSEKNDDVDSVDELAENIEATEEEEGDEKVNERTEKKPEEKKRKPGIVYLSSIPPG
jgi:hypothetical protein